MALREIMAFILPQKATILSSIAIISPQEEEPAVIMVYVSLPARTILF